VVKKSNRRIVVFLSLVSVLTLTSALLLALAPAPLKPDSTSSLFALDTPEAMEAVFQTKVAPKTGKWKYIYVHHAARQEGNAISLSDSPGGLADHFVIGNGNGAIDGEIQMGQRWNQQVSANPPRGATQIDSNCISICMVGDFDHAVPTAMQLQRLTQLVNALQGRFDIPAGQVLLLSDPNSQAGMGRYFPATAFREQLLP
jgi:N-acetyl-anhydromuramyl-L-alanine amidase AmpD